MAGSGRRDGPTEWTLGDRYRVGREIGRGSYGVVHRAIDLRSEQAIAVKLVDLERDGGPEDAATERIGAGVQQRFGQAHPGVVPEVFEHGEISGYYAIAMELIEAPSLSQTLAKQGPLSGERAAGIAQAIASFLDRARKFGAAQSPDGGGGETIVHGDLKPQHVKLLPDGTIRILDFGIAHALSTSRTSATARGTSTHYASPELLETGRVRPQEDWWALGIILFEMLAGVVPYHRYTLQPSLERAIRSGAPRDTLPPGTDPVLAAIVDKLLRPQPERRYPSAAAIARDLGAFLDSEPTIAASEAATAPTVRLPPAAAAASPSFDVPTLPVPRPAAWRWPARRTAPGATGDAAATSDAATQGVPPAATRVARRWSWRRIALMAGVPLALAMLNGMLGDEPRTARPSANSGGPAAPEAAAADRVAPLSPLDMEFVRIPPGEFMMGCSPDDGECAEDESPRHAVRITRAFEIGKYEVTLGQWNAAMGGSPAARSSLRYPVTANFVAVREFLDRLNAREDGFQYQLPTEAEWEYAARAGTGTAHGGSLHEMAWAGTGPDHEVGGKQPNAWGLHDMLGNTHEWVQDWYARYRSGAATDPAGPATGDHRVLRGGDSVVNASHVRVSARSYALESAARGFRVVRVPVAAGEGR